MTAHVQVRLDGETSRAAAMLTVGKSCGCALIELAGSDADLLDLEISQVFAEQVAPLLSADEFACAALCVDGTCTGHLADDDRPERRGALNRAVRLIEAAEERRIQRISIVPAAVAADCPRRVGYQDALNRTTEALERLARLAERSGVQVCLRASRAGFLTSPPELREMVALINSPAVGVDLDVVNRCDLAPWTDWLTTLEPYVQALGITVDPRGGGKAAKAQLVAAAAEADRVCAPLSFRGSLVLRCPNS